MNAADMIARGIEARLLTDGNIRPWQELLDVISRSSSTLTPDAGLREVLNMIADGADDMVLAFDGDRSVAHNVGRVQRFSALIRAALFEVRS